MPQSTNLNVTPYYDDFQSSKDFYRVLFRPGYSIQSRELTTLQSVLQNQLESVGKYLMKEGSMVVPGEISFNNQYSYIKISSYSQGFTLSQFLGATLTGQTTGVIAKVLNVTDETSSDAVTFFVRYESSGTSTINRRFQEGEIISTDIVGAPTAVIGITGSTRPTVYKPYGSGADVSLEQSNATGYGSAVFVQEGIYYINGHFVRNSAQTLVVDKYASTPSARVGFLVQEDLITPDEDESLNDNASGFSNYAAPGAHRLKITLTLASRNIGEAVENNFIELLRIRDGKIERKVEKQSWSDIEEILARRTYDESGDYVVKNYNLEIKNHKDDRKNNGVYPLGADGLYNKLTSEESDTKIVAALSPGKAYVRGYEIESVGTKYKTFDRARDTLTRERASLSIPIGSSLNVQNVLGSPEVDSLQAHSTNAHSQLKLYNRFIDSYLGNTKTNRGTPPNVRYLLHIENLDAQATYDWVGNFAGGYDAVQTKNQNGGPSKASVVAGSVLKLDATAPVGTIQNGSATSNVCDQYLMLVNLDTSAERMDSSLEIEDLNGGVASGTARGIIRGVYELNTKPVGVATPKFIKNVSSVTDSAGRISSGENRDSIFKLGIFDTSTFVSIKIHSNLVHGKYTSGLKTEGARLTGVNSGAQGVVEAHYAGDGYDEILLSNVKGKFLGGEDVITDPDDSVSSAGRISKGTIIKDGTIKKIHVVDSGTGYATVGNNPTELHTITVGFGLEWDAGTSTWTGGHDIKFARNLGSTIFPWKCTANTDGGLQAIELDDGATSGDIFPNEWSYRSPKARVFTSVPEAKILSTGNIAATLRVELWDNCINTYTMKDVKSVADFSSNFNFTADVITDNSGFYNFTNIGQATGTAGNDYFELASITVDPSLLLKEDDLIKVISDKGKEFRYLVRYVHRSTSGTPGRIYVQGPLVESVTNSQIVKIEAKINDGNRSSLIFKCPDPVVKTVAKDPTKSGFMLKCVKNFASTVSAGNTLTFNLQGENKDFAGFSSSNYVAVVKDKSTATGLDNGDVLNLSSYEFSRTLATTSVNSQVTWSGLPATWAGAVIKLQAPIIIRNAKPRSKILKNAQLPVSTFRTDDIINLKKTDGFRINGVYMSGDPDALASVNDIDIQDRFIFDNGQRDNFYDIARLIRKAGTEEPAGQLLVDFDYFDHQNDGHFFSVDSYINASNLTLDYGDVPTYLSEREGLMSLRDCVDFRLSPNDEAQGQIAGAEDKNETGALSYTDIETFMPTPSESIEFTYDFYLPRKDSIYLTKKGSFEVVQGVPSIVPQYPNPIQDSIRLFDLDVPAYTFNPKSVKIRSYNHRRYTMKDIRDLDRRIETMEYYTTLSLLEQDTLNVSIKDSVSGLDRFKSGIIVDNFAGHNVGDTWSSEYKCSIDMQSQQLRPQHYTDEIHLSEKLSDDDSRASKGYKKSGSIVTLDYSEEEVIKNPFATETVNLNPFLVFQYKGNLNMNPDIDEWKDTVSRPDLVVRDNNLFDTIENMADERGVLGTVWNEWQTSWSGSQTLASSTTTTSNNSLNGLNTGNNTFVTGMETTATSSITGRTRTRTRTGTRNTLSGFDTVRQNFGNRVIGVAFQPFMRSRPVAFSVTSLKPNTRVYAFFEGIDVNAWVCPDSVYTGNALNSPKGFGQPIVTDANGNVSGILIIPNGHSPVGTFTTGVASELSTRGISGDELDRRRVSQSSSDEAYNYQNFTGVFEDLIYDTTSTQRQFRVGERTFRLTSSSTNSQLEDQVDTFAEKEYFAMGLLETTERTITSTRVPTIAQRSVSDSDSAQFIDGIRTTVDTDVNTQQIWSDPVAQTFLIEGYGDGMFMSSLEVFFKTKSKTVPVSCYLTETLQGTPGKKAIPFSTKTLNPDTTLRVVSDAPVSFVAGETIIGLSSGATGTVKNNLSIEAATATTNFGNTVYSLVLDNHNGKTFEENEVLSIQRFPEPTAVTKIARSTFAVNNIEMSHGGSNYTTATVTIGAPQQVGGVQATARANVDVITKQVIDIVVTNPGSGYTSEPSVSISGDGSGALALSKIRNEFISVDMGVSISEDASSGTTFKFDAPVYLENNREYAFVVITNTIDYNMFISRLGENEIGSTQRVSTQPYLGSLFKSQNSTVWTADQFEDVKFTLNRAKFVTNSTATVEFTNDKLPSKLLGSQPIETNKLSYRGQNNVGESIYTSATAPESYADNLFGANPRIVMIHHRDHGMTDGDYVVLRGVTGVGSSNPLANGISVNKLNSVHKISNVGLDHYCIELAKDSNSENDQATESGRCGSDYIWASSNKQFQVVQPQIGILQFASNAVNHTITALKSSAVDYINPNDLMQDTFAVVPGENIYLQDNYQILSEINEVYQNRGDKSLSYIVKMSTSNDAVSPVLDLDRVNLYATANRIDRPSQTDERFGYQVYRIYPYSNTPAGGGLSTLGPIANNGQALSVGQRIINMYKTDTNGIRDYGASGTSEPEITGKIEAEIVAVNQDENYIDIRYLLVPQEDIKNGTATVLTKGQRFGPEDLSNAASTPFAFTVSGGSDVFYIHTDPINRGGYLYMNEEESAMGNHSAKYQTKVVTLENPAQNLDVRITANMFDNKDVQLMYKIKPVSSDKNMGSQPWQYFNPKFEQASQLKDITIVDGGSGYTTAPALTITPNNGATATPYINTATNKVDGIVITNRGSGFSSPPKITIDDSTGGGGSGLDAISLVSGGTTYKPNSGTATYTAKSAIYSSDSPTTLPSTGSGGTVTVTVTNGSITVISIDAKGAGYTKNEILTLDPTFDGDGLGSGLKFKVDDVDPQTQPTTLAVAEASIFPVDFDEETSGLSDDYENIEIDDSSVLDPFAEDPNSFKEYKFTVEDLPEFDRFAVKIIMKQNTSRGPAFVPKIEDFRCIATA